jgi:GrpB-like predicted nucleotidyltransferase (UPF0157 family)
MSAATAVVIVPYQERWPEDFSRIAGELHAALGDLALRIDHIGSTSVLGLASKDRIDVLVGVASLEPVEALRAALPRAGCALRWEHVHDHRPPGDDSPLDEWAKHFAARVDGQPANIHIRVVGRRNWRYAMLFRDYLRAHPAAAAAYGQVKERLSALPGMHIEHYVDVKDPVCDIIMVAAEEWAARTGWEA